MAKETSAVLAYWQGQMRFADEAWEEAGWKASAKISKPGSAELATQYLSAYRGQQWGADGWMGMGPESCAVTPLFFASANTFVAGLIARSPEISVLPRRPGTADAARKIQAVLNYDVYELKMKRQWRRTVFDAFFCPFGITRHGYTPSQEFETEKDADLLEWYAGARPDKPWIRRWTLWDTRIDASAETPDSDGDARWCGFRTLMTKDQIAKNPKMKLPRGMQATVKLTVPSPKGPRHAEKKSASPDEYFEVWSIYDKTDKSWLQIDGNYEYVLRREDAWPIPWEDLPYDALYFNPQADTLFPIPYAASIFPTVVMRNKLRTINEELIKRLRRVIPYSETLLGEGSKDKLEGLNLVEFIGFKGEINNAIGNIQLGGFDQSLMLYDQMLVQDVREALGQSSMDRAQRINVESATEAAGVAQGSAKAEGRNIDSLEDYLDSSVRHYAIARRATMKSDETVALLGPEDARILITDIKQEYLTVTTKDMKAEVDFIIKQGSTLPDSKQRRVADALADIQVASQFPQLHNIQEILAAYHRARGNNPAKVMLNDQQIAATAGQGMPDEPVDSSQLIGQVTGLQ
jgi:hypothetical protein